MAEIAVTVAILLGERIVDALCKEANSKKNVSTEIESMNYLLSSLRAYLRDHNSRGSQNAMQQNKVAQILGIAHKIEDALDRFMYRTPQKFHKHRVTIFAHRYAQPMKGAGALRELSSKISEIKNCATDLIAREQVTKPPETIAEVASSSHDAYWRDDSFVHLPGEDEMVGFKKHKVKLIDQLISEESDRHMDIAVVGPGGFGKSTLVRNAFVDKRVKRHFECSAWVSITQNFDKTELVDDIILQFQDEKKRWQYLREGEPVSVSFATGDKRSYVRNYLQNKRYIVVLDDVFNQEDLQFIESFLPKNGVGSRIIITTHKHDLAFSHDGSPRRIHDLSGGLPLDAAWNLFCKKAFRASSGKCPHELESIAQRILSNCGGSPFAIVAVSRMLAMKPQLPVEWEAFHDSLGSEIGTDPKWIVSRTLLRSYNDLSSTLKSCFVYLSIFPKNYHIERGRLIRLWLAEGFVKHANRKVLERVADDYLDELIARNLIHVTERDFSGRVSTCEVKNLVHEFLINMSDEENFVTIYSVEDSETNNSQPRRVSIHAATFNPSKSSSVILSSVRSSFVFAQIEDFQSKIQKFISQFMLLKVLDLQGSSLEDFPEEICGLTLLRYLSLRDTKIQTIPKSITKLVYIETLDLKQTQVKKLPKQILRLPNLRYLLVYLYDVENYVTFDCAKGVEIYPEVRFLSKLLKLTLIKADNQQIFAELGYLKKLRKLGLIDLKTEDGGKLCAAIQKMTQLSTLDVRSECASKYLDLHDMQNPPSNLQRLYLKGRLKKIPVWISSLKSLVRIGLKWSKVQDSPIPVLQVLPNLIELELVAAYTGEELTFGAGTFSKLKTLHIEEFTELTTIVMEENAMPKLGKLALRNCKSLAMPPLGINHHAQLEELLAYDMNDKFTGALRPSSETYWMVERIPVIRSFYSRGNRLWIMNNLS